jgi:hypothetical protein
MKPKLLLLFCFTISFILSAYSQNAKISGKVLDEKTGEVLIGATVSIESLGKTVKSDQNGYYSISGLTEGNYTITCTNVSFEKRVLTNIFLKSDEVLNQDILMNKNLGAMTAIVVQGSSSNSKPKETISSLLVAQKNSSSVSDGISAETIKKTPDKNTSDILKRVSGASIQDDKFVIVRGLNDRYNSAYINGAPLPSTEPDRKAFSFDIFPSNMLDNLIINKTATPEMPAEFAGGSIVVNTKDIVSKNFQTFSFGTGYNLQATYKTFRTYEGGKYDFLGIDDKTRALPNYFPTMADFPRPAILNPTLAAPWKNVWSTNTETTPSNLSLQYVFAKNYQRKEKDFFGTIISATYNKNYNITSGFRQLYQEEIYNPNSTNPKEYYSDQNVYSKNILAGLIANFTCKINSNNSLGFKNIYSINAEDKVITREGYTSNVFFQTEKNLWFTSNKIYSGQIFGEHYLQKSKIKINWLLGYTNINRDIPDLRTTIYTKSDSLSRLEANISQDAQIGVGGGIYYSYLREKSKNIKIDLQRKFNYSNRFTTNIKVGFYHQSRERDYSQRVFAMLQKDKFTFNQNFKYLPEDKIYTHIGGNDGFVLSERLDFTNNYQAQTNLNALYIMFDQRIINSFRLIYGARNENFATDLTLPIGVGSNLPVHSFVRDFLPSSSIIYSVDKKQNIRLCYSKTLNRPEFRELCPGKFYDFATKFVTNGDTKLKRSLIDNLDLRYEAYPGKNQFFTFSLFYKYFANPIEQATAPEKGDEAAYFNVVGAKNKGVELEFRTLLKFLTHSSSPNNFFNNLTFSTNFSLIKSSVTAKKESDTSTLILDRTLQGQSPFCFNAGLLYQNNQNTLSFSLSANRIGDRLYAVGNIKNPDVFEKGRTVLDFQISKSFKTNEDIEIKLNAKDILAQKAILYENSDGKNGFSPTTDFVRISRRFGQVISLTFTYKL